MARTQSFDREAVIRDARSLFWRTGFDAASVPEIEEVTGLSRSSIYNTFGSKRGLFDAAVQSYLDEVIRPRLAPLTREPVAPEALGDYLSGLRGAFLAHGSLPATSGCLLVNTAGSPIAGDESVARVIADYRAELHTAIARGVAARAPELGTEARERVADTITGLVIAAFALARVEVVQSVRSIDTALATLDAPR